MRSYNESWRTSGNACHIKLIFGQTSVYLTMIWIAELAIHEGGSSNKLPVFIFSSLASSKTRMSRGRVHQFLSITAIHWKNTDWQVYWFDLKVYSENSIIVHHIRKYFLQSLKISFSKALKMEKPANKTETLLFKYNCVNIRRIDLPRVKWYCVFELLVMATLQQAQE